MEFKDVLQKRRAVRSYKGTPIEASMIQSLIEAAIQAPSARDLQPWLFWRILGRERIDDMAKRATASVLQMLAKDASAQADLKRLSDPMFSMLYHAPALVLAVARSSEERADEDCCLAAMSLMLAARDAELGTCWISLSRPWFNLLSTKQELGIPETARVVAPIVTGHANEWPELPGRNPAEIHSIC